MQQSGIYVPEDWIGRRVRVEYRSLEYGAGEDFSRMHELEGTLTGATDLGVLINDHNLIAYGAIAHLHIAE